MIQGVGCGWVEVFIVAHGPAWSLLGRRSTRDPSQGFSLFLFFLFSRISLHIHRRPRTFIHFITLRVYFLVQFFTYVMSMECIAKFRSERRVVCY